MEEIKEFLHSRSQLIERTLDQLIPKHSDPSGKDHHLSYETLFDAARYSLLGGGKRLRPMLTLAAAETFGVKTEQALFPACAIEMIHTYSLIHDDLPCMDDDDFRRGKPSLHKAYSESLAVLTGDFLLTKAFEVIAMAPMLSDAQKLKITLLLSKRAGAYGMIGGQIMDMAAENRAITLDEMRKLHQHKTGALLAASLECGAIIAGQTEEIIRKMGQFGFEVGLAFQIVDDILDVTSAETHGKKVSSDSINGKTTYVTLLGVTQSQAMADTLLSSALNILSTLSVAKDLTLLKEMAYWVVKRSTDVQSLTQKEKTDARL